MTTSEPTSTSLPPVSPSSNKDFLVRDEPESLEVFSIPAFNFHVDSDDDNSLMTRSEFHELNKKMDQFLLRTNSFSPTNGKTWLKLIK